jgi:hypothetical protein
LSFDLFVHYPVDLGAEAGNQNAELTDHYEAVGAFLCKVVFKHGDAPVLAAGCFSLSCERKT